MKKTFLTLLLSLSLFLGISALSYANLIGPDWPAPGGTTYTATGLGIAHDGGRTFSYSGFDFSASDDLYWGLSADFDQVISLTNRISSPFEVLEIDTFTGNQAEWRGISWLDNANTGNLDSVLTRLVIDLTGDASFVDSSSLDTRELEPLAFVTGDFQAQLVGEISQDNGTTWHAIDPYFDSYQTQPGDQYSINIGGAFYSTPATAPVPEPATTLLIGAGVAGLLGTSRLRRKKK